MLITKKTVLKKYAASKCLWLGIPSIEVTKKGRTFLTFYSGGVKEEIGNFSLLVKSDDGVNFGDPIAVCVEEGHRCYDPCVWIDPLGRLWLTWSRSPDDALYGAICEDPDADKIVFGEEFFIGHNVMMNKPIILSTGEWAFPIAVWEKHMRVLPPEYDTKDKTGSYMYVTVDQGKSFNRRGVAHVKDRTYDEHMFLELESGIIRMFVRTSYGIGAADSYDGGYHWGIGFDTGYNGPSSRFHIRRLPSGRVLLINHYNYKGRNNLTALLSEDEGKTFPYHLLLDERNDVAYPDATVVDGKIYITYDRERGAFKSCMRDVLNSAREILTACITEEDIINGSLINQESYLKRVAYKLTNYNGTPQNPFNERDLFSNKNYINALAKCDWSADEIVTLIFNEFEANCANIPPEELGAFDGLIARFKHKKEIAVLNRIIAVAKIPRCEIKRPSKDFVDEICRYILDNIEKNCTDKGIATHFSTSEYYIHHIFKKQTGITIPEFKTAQILKKAKLLLKSGECDISAVAAACGFHSPTHFVEEFTKQMRISPQKYIENNK